jgi:hypothetical protein
MSNKEEMAKTHKQHEVEAIQKAHQVGLSYEEIRKAFDNVPYGVIASILENRTRPCAFCQHPFYPAKETTRFGSRDCLSAAMRELGSS